MTLGELLDELDSYVGYIHLGRDATIQLSIIEARDADSCFAECRGIEVYWDEGFIVLSNEQE